MKSANRWSLVLCGICIGSLWGGACGGSGGNSTAGQFQTGGSQVHMHVSSTMGPSTIGSFAEDSEIASITFTPKSPSDLLLYVIVEGTASPGTTADNTYWLEIKDAAGHRIRRIKNTSGFLATGSGQPFRMVISLPMEWDYEVSAARPPCSLDFTYPSTSYSVRFSMDTGASWSGSFDTIVFKVFSLEGVTVDAPSSRIS
jgi:hypothetical protein